MIRLYSSTRKVQSRYAKLGLAHYRGFTLLEMLVVLFLLSLIAAIAYPRLSSVIAAYEQRQQEAEFWNQLQSISWFCLQQNSPNQWILPDIGSSDIFDTQDDTLANSSPDNNALAAFLQEKLPAAWSFQPGTQVSCQNNGVCDAGQVILKTHLIDALTLPITDLSCQVERP